MSFLSDYLEQQRRVREDTVAKREADASSPEELLDALRKNTEYTADLIGSRSKDAKSQTKSVLDSLDTVAKTVQDLAEKADDPDTRAATISVQKSSIQSNKTLNEIRDALKQLASTNSRIEKHLRPALNSKDDTYVKRRSMAAEVAGRVRQNVKTVNQAGATGGVGGFIDAALDLMGGGGGNNKGPTTTKPTSAPKGGGRWARILSSAKNMPGIAKIALGGAAAAGAGAAAASVGSETKAAGAAAQEAKVAQQATKAVGTEAKALGSAASAASASSPSAVSRASNLLGRAATPIAIGMSGYEAYETEQDKTLSRDQKNVKHAGTAGGLAGGLAGAGYGAAAGAAMGSVVPLVGTAVGGVVGGLVGGIGGYMGGKSIGETAMGGLQSARDAMPEGLKTALGMTVAAAVSPFSQDARDALKKDLIPAIEGASKSFNESTKSFTGLLGSVGDKISDSWKSLEDSKFGQAMGAGWQGVKAGFGAAREAAGKTWEAAKQGWKEGGISGAMDKAGEAAKSGWTSIKDKSLGAVSAFFESGKKGVGTVSSGKGDFGGVSYGKHQLATNNGSMAAFLASKEAGSLGKEFAGLKPGTPEFNAKYKELTSGSRAGEMEEAQRAYMQRTHFDPQAAKLKSEMGVDVGKESRAFQEAVWSTSTQYGANSSIIQKAFAGKDFSKMSDEDKIKTLQQYKADNVGTNFKSSSGAVQESIRIRAQKEQDMLLGMLKDPNAKGTAVTQSISQDDQDRETKAMLAKANAKVSEPTTVAAAPAKPKKKPLTEAQKLAKKEAEAKKIAANEEAARKKEAESEEARNQAELDLARKMADEEEARKLAEAEAAKKAAEASVPAPEPVVSVAPSAEPMGPPAPVAAAPVVAAAAAATELKAPAVVSAGGHQSTINNPDGLDRSRFGGEVNGKVWDKKERKWISKAEAVALSRETAGRAAAATAAPTPAPEVAAAPAPVAAPTPPAPPATPTPAAPPTPPAPVAQAPAPTPAAYATAGGHRSEFNNTSGLDRGRYGVRELNGKVYDKQTGQWVPKAEAVANSQSTAPKARGLPELAEATPEPTVTARAVTALEEPAPTAATFDEYVSSIKARDTPEIRVAGQGLDKSRYGREINGKVWDKTTGTWVTTAEALANSGKVTQQATAPSAEPMGPPAPVAQAPEAKAPAAAAGAATGQQLTQSGFDKSRYGRQIGNKVWDKTTGTWVSVDEAKAGTEANAVIAKASESLTGAPTEPMGPPAPTETAASVTPQPTVTADSAAGKAQYGRTIGNQRWNKTTGKWEKVPEADISQQATQVADTMSWDDIASMGEPEVRARQAPMPTVAANAPEEVQSVSVANASEIKSEPASSTAGTFRSKDFDSVVPTLDNVPLQVTDMGLILLNVGHL